jgi:imidazolonepropionase-like amidohydrolase
MTFREIQPPTAEMQNLSTSNSRDDDFVDINRFDEDLSNVEISYRPWLPGPQKPYVLINAKLVDPRTSTVLPKRTIHLAEGKIVHIKSTKQSDLVNEFYYGDVKAQKIDASDYFICPGLIDCHVHLMSVHGSSTLQGAFSFPHEIAAMRSAGLMRGILANGFTTVRDTGGATIAHAQATEEFLVPGPRVFQGGRMLSQTGGHGDDTEVWLDYHCCGGSGIGESALGRLCDGVPECLKAARDNIRKGANHLKVCTSGGIASQTDKLESLQFTVEELQAITTVAKNMGATRVTAHCYTAEGVQHAIKGGVTGIEHGNMIDMPTVKLMAEHDMILTPTLGLHTFLTMPPYDKFQNEKSMEKNALVGNAGAQAIRMAEEEGVTVCFGTDTTGPTLPMQTFEV